METRLRRYEKSPKDGRFEIIGSELVTFIAITGKKSAIVEDKKGKRKTVRRKSLLDVPNSVLYPEMTIVGKSKPNPENWKKACYYN